MGNDSTPLVIKPAFSQTFVFQWIDLQYDIKNIAVY
jgi:hypothetical protein